MINLENKCVLVRTVEEYEKIMEEAIKQGFKHEYCKDIPSLCSNCAYILKFYKETYEIKVYPLLEASELLGTKELTAKEFIDFIINSNYNCATSTCDSCELFKYNTKCKRNLCSVCNLMKGYEEELIEFIDIAKSSMSKSDKTTIKPEKEEVIEALEQFFYDPNNKKSSIKKAIKYAIDNLKKEGK